MVNRCHLLVVWDRHDDGYQLAQNFLASCWEPGADRFAANGDPIPVGIGQVADVAERALRHKGLVRAPHSTQKDIGFFAKGVCTNRGEVLKKNLISGFDIYGNVTQDALKNPKSEFTDLPDVRSFDSIGTRASYHTIEAETGEEGVQLARERRPALGLSACRWLRARDLTRDSWSPSVNSAGDSKSRLSPFRKIC